VKLRGTSAPGHSHRPNSSGPRTPGEDKRNSSTHLPKPRIAFAVWGPERVRREGEQEAARVAGCQHWVIHREQLFAASLNRIKNPTRIGTQL
jgi:hypothetical protein